MSTSLEERGDTRSLVQLCGGYFGSYVLTGVLVKYFTSIREPRLSDMTYLVNNTLGGSLLALSVVFAVDLDDDVDRCVCPAVNSI